MVYPNTGDVAVLCKKIKRQVLVVDSWLIARNIDQESNIQGLSKTLIVIPSCESMFALGKKMSSANKPYLLFIYYRVDPTPNDSRQLTF